MTMPDRIYAYHGKQPKRQPPPKRKRVLDFVMAEIGLGHGFPDVEKIRRYMGWRNHQSARDALNGLVGDGWMKRIYIDNRVVWEVAG